MDTTEVSQVEDYAVCLECGAEDVFFSSHNAGCTEAGDIITKQAPEWDLMSGEVR
jgi:hypothetical protein